LASLLLFTHSFLLQCVGEIVQSRVGEATNEATASSAVNLIDTTLSMLIPLISVAKPEEMCVEAADFSLLALDLLKISSGKVVMHLFIF
jgi:hypothetical protein